MRVELLVCLAAVVAPAAFAQDPGSVRRGHAYAERVCGSCHAIGAGVARSPEAAAPSFEAIANTPGMTGMALTAWLRSPHPTMPGVIVSDDRIVDLVAYLGTLKTKR